ncbi:2,3-bisphosphoglycerate-dependent phosphoglycerate mutase [Paenibacillus algorifonticola]|uniref:2,3-bisphosphoglycerate-dependent phosphoglycerate mutase n=1 Tax=Paenibacillus algorifonticola TaxID=684063 RepID=A0A1I1Y6C0_9BACL|nr:histidine phosphatase family protein [Paenibacillus algorifonticola]SFE15195.1 2,3-bisphosphoglycerate-dependent phosphoglycerate mutase [Paenibacillus algorifonticola]
MHDEVTLYLVRHGRATGNQTDAPLSTVGVTQSEQLADDLASMGSLHVDQLISSPYLRAWQTAQIIEKRLNLKLEPAEIRLREQGVPGIDKEESAQEVSTRVVAFTNELLNSGGQTFLLVSHRLTLTLLLQHYVPDFTDQQGEQMTNPDLYELRFKNGTARQRRLWSPEAHHLIET